MDFEKKLDKKGINFLPSYSIPTEIIYIYYEYFDNNSIYSCLYYVQKQVFRWGGDIQLLAYNFSVIRNSSIRGGHVYFKQPNISEIIKSVGKSVVERLINGYGKEANKTIIHESRTYSGLGNQVRSLVGSIAIALASGRKLRSNTIEWYSS